MNRLLHFAWKPVIVCALLSCGLSTCSGERPAKEYWVKLVCESADRIATVRFGPGGAAVEKTTETRILQSDISGPHGIAFSPDKKNFYVTIGHGRPFGTALKYETATDRVLKQVTLGLFPATADVTPRLYTPFPAGIRRTSFHSLVSTSTISFDLLQAT